VGRNSVEDAQRLGPLRLLGRQVGSPLVLILNFAAAVSLSLSQSVVAGIILAIVVGSSLLGFSQEYASAAVEELKKRLALTSRVPFGTVASWTRWWRRRGRFRESRMDQDVYRRSQRAFASLE
jgi:magnesium-transporting ATPase (P-type)